MAFPQRLNARWGSSALLCQFLSAEFGGIFSAMRQRDNKTERAIP
jgi:hypothetical protein